MDFLLAGAITLTSLNIVGSLVVVIMYLRAWRHAPGSSKALPLHVWLVASGHTLYAIGATIGLSTDPTLIRVILFSTGSILVLMALAVIIRRGRSMSHSYEAGFAEIPAVVIRDSRHPHEVWVAFLCFLAGLTLLVSGAEPGTLEALLPGAMLYVYGSVLVLGGTALIVGIAWRDHLVELAGLVGLSVMLLVYMLGAFLIPEAPKDSLLAVLTFIAACVWRMWQIKELLQGRTKIRVEAL